MNIFERYLSLWVALCIVVGVLLGNLMPGAFQAIGAMEVARVNFPVGILIWVMIIPMLMKVDFGALHQVREHVKGIGVTLFRFESGTALATVVGVLIEVPVMLLVVRVVNATRPWYEARTELT